MLVSVRKEEVEEIEVASVLGELFRPFVLAQTEERRPCEGRRIVVLDENGQKVEFYVKHTKTEGLDEFGKKVMNDDFVLIALRSTTLKTIVIDMRQKAPH